MKLDIGDFVCLERSLCHLHIWRAWLADNAQVLAYAYQAVSSIGYARNALWELLFQSGWCYLGMLTVMLM